MRKQIENNTKQRAGEERCHREQILKSESMKAPCDAAWAQSAHLGNGDKQGAPDPAEVGREGGPSSQGISKYNRNKKQRLLLRNALSKILGRFL